MTTGWIIAMALLYVVLSPLAVWYMQGRFKGTLPEKLITVLGTPGCLFIMIFIAAPLSIPYFMLYPERHAMAVDFEGNEDEKAELAAYRQALSKESLWCRILFFTGMRPASENRILAQERINKVWKRFQERTGGSTFDGGDGSGTVGEK